MQEKFKGGVSVFIGACSFGVLSTIVKTAYELGYSVGEITGSQSMFGAIMLWAIYLLQKQEKKQAKPASAGKPSGESSSWWKIALAGSFTGLVGIFYYKCVSILPASIAIILLMQYLWVSILIEWVVFKKRPQPIQLVAACVVLGGTILAGGVFNESLHLDTMGVFYGFLAAISYSIFLMTSGRVGNDLPVFKKSALMITGSVAITWLIFPPLFLFSGVLIEGLYTWGIVLALLGAAIPPLFFSYGIPKVGVSMGAILSAAELPVAVVSSYFILQEEVVALQWLGVAIILGAIMLANLKLDRVPK